MTTITPSGLFGAEGVGNDLTGFDVGVFGDPVIADPGEMHGLSWAPHEFSIYFADGADTFAITFTGHGFDAPAPDHIPTTGTITGVKIIDYSAPDTGAVLTATWSSDMSETPIILSIPLFRHLVMTHDTTSFINFFFGGVDSLGGSEDDDNLFGYGGNDTINSFEGDDVLNGGDGDDILTGHTGTDQLFGDAGDDQVYAYDGTSGDVYDGGSGGETTGDALLAFGEDGNNDDLGEVDLRSAELAGFEILTFNPASDLTHLTLTLTGEQTLTAFALATQVLGSNDTTDILIIQDSPEDVDISQWSFTSWETRDVIHVYGDAGGNMLTGAASKVTTLIGGGGADTLFGGTGADSLYGSQDTPDGAQDDMFGGEGDDIYAVYELTDIIHEGVNEGVDYAAVRVNNYVMAANLNNIALYGSARTATGNAIANGITGNAAVNTLNGMGGADALSGDAGNDALSGGVGADQLFGDAGSDTASYAASTAAVNVNLTTGVGAGGEAAGDSFDSIENLLGSTKNDTLTGQAGANTLTGGAGNDTLKGMSGADTLVGGAGKDTMTGGANGDKFVFNVAATAANVDTITDFTHASDKIHLENSVFTALGATGALAATKFFAGANAHDANDRIIYNAANGQLSYDANGNAAGQKVLIATLDAGLTITASDFVVI